MEECLHTKLTCIFCKSTIDSTTIDTVVNHFKNYCVKVFKSCSVNYNNSDSKAPVLHIIECDERTYNVKKLPAVPCVIKVDGEYIVLCDPVFHPAPKINFIVMSPIVKYKESTYKIEIQNLDRTFTLCSDIHYNEMIQVQHSSTHSMLEGNFFNFVIHNKFMLGIDAEFTHIMGEPGSPGNWTPEFYAEMREKFTSLFEKMNMTVG